LYPTPEKKMRSKPIMYWKNEYADGEVAPCILLVSCTEWTPDQ
jgi:hypothetical protein